MRLSGKQIVEMRTALGYSTSALAKKAGVAQSTLWRIEAGHDKQIHPTVRKAILKALGVSETPKRRSIKLGDATAAEEISEAQSQVVEVVKKLRSRDNLGILAGLAERLLKLESQRDLLVEMAESLASESEDGDAQ